MHEVKDCNPDALQQECKQTFPHCYYCEVRYFDQCEIWTAITDLRNDMMSFRETLDVMKGRS